MNDEKDKKLKVCMYYFTSKDPVRPEFTIHENQRGRWVEGGAVMINKTGYQIKRVEETGPDSVDVYVKVEYREYKQI